MFPSFKINTKLGTEHQSSVVALHQHRNSLEQKSPYSLTFAFLKYGAIKYRIRCLVARQPVLPWQPFCYNLYRRTRLFVLEKLYDMVQVNANGRTGKEVEFLTLLTMNC